MDYLWTTPWRSRVLADAALSRLTPLERTHKREVRLCCPAHHSRSYSLIDISVLDLRNTRVWGDNVWPDFDSIELNTNEPSSTESLPFYEASS